MLVSGLWLLTLFIFLTSDDFPDSHGRTAGQCRTAARLELHSDGELRRIFDNEMQAVAEILGDAGREVLVT